MYKVGVSTDGLHAQIVCSFCINYYSPIERLIKTDQAHYRLAFLTISPHGGNQTNVEVLNTNTQGFSSMGMLRKQCFRYKCFNIANYISDLIGNECT